VRAPNKSRLDEVVQEIVAEIQSDPDRRDDATELDVRTTIRLLRARDQEVAYRGTSKERMPTRGKRQENVEDFTTLLKEIKRLRKALQKMSAPALILLFSGEDDVSTDEIPSAEVQQKVERRLRQITATLSYMQARCDSLLAARPGEHGHAEYRQRRVAHEAWRLLRRHGKKPAGGTLDSLYGRIASLLYEAMTGTADLDLQWACKAALRLADEGGLSDGPVIGRGRISLS
jgi:hypothetical protein